jgi:hypothetical protein
MDLFLGVGLVVGGLGEDVVLGVMAFACGVGRQFVGRVHVGLELVHHEASFHHYKIISNSNSPILLEGEVERVESGLIMVLDIIRYGENS